MIILVCYDVDTRDAAGARRLRRLADACKGYGVRVQYSVFECRIDAADWVVLKNRLLNEAKLEHDSLRFYYVNDRDAERTEHHGVRRPTDPTAPLVV